MKEPSFDYLFLSHFFVELFREISILILYLKIFIFLFFKYIAYIAIFFSEQYHFYHLKSTFEVSIVFRSFKTSLCRCEIVQNLKILNYKTVQFFNTPSSYSEKYSQMKLFSKLKGKNDKTFSD